ncbi:MAG TPA: hypothetical protein VJU86_06410 [Pyrinomonadaceae bacterium]|nr:hypothetical protein [Pyrinomonadaceae bacterium]
MISPLFGLLILICCFGHGDLAPASIARSSQSACPKLAIEYPHDLDTSEFRFKVKVEGEKVANQALTYEWTADGGEIKEGQGTSLVRIVNFDLAKKSLTVIVNVRGLPQGCSGYASCTISIRPPHRALQ